VLIDVHAGAVLTNTMSSDSDYVQEEVASESGDADVDVDSDAERFASASGVQTSDSLVVGDGEGATEAHESLRHQQLQAKQQTKR
jgi:hypothetical protein